MEYREDLKCLSWDVLYRKLIDAEQVATEYSDTIIAFGRKVRALEAELKSAQDKLAAQAPVFEIGKCYRTRDGRIVEVCENVGDERFPLYHKKPGTKREAYHGISADGKSCILSYGCDLLPGPVDPPPTWTPPASMENGEWKFLNGHMMHPSGRWGFYRELRQAIWHDWTDPPPGRWRVENGTATWMGDA